ncbi:MAG: UPF0280 family protein [Thermoplasmata archaeon]|jgi:hypothetical protein|nr:UPF0280 family protein [Thermoplasmata archaeon]
MNEFVHAKVEIGETAATIAAERRFLADAVTAIKAARAQVERKVRQDRFFLTTLEPYEPNAYDGRVVKRMCEATTKTGVGPMAAVAGAVAAEAVEAMVRAGCSHGWVDNGGDVALKLDSAITLEVFSDPDSGKAFGFGLGPTKGTIGICSSSGRLGHSISFGDSDVVVAIAEDAVLADALATAIGNRVTDRESLRTCFDPFKAIRGAFGFLAMLDGEVSVFGEVPDLVEVEHNADRLTVHSRMSSDKYTGSGRAASG